MNKFYKLIGIISIVATVGLMVLGAVVFAQGPEGDTATDSGINIERLLGWGRGGDRVRLEGLREHVHAAKAEALGLTVEELETAKAEGQRLSEVAEAQGVDVESVKAAAETARQEFVAQAVTDGVITQEQADQILAHDGHCKGKRGHRGGRSNRGAPTETLGNDTL